MTDNRKISIAYGDGIGPEIMEACIKILKEAKANLCFETIEVGKKMYERGYQSGIPDDAWDKIYDCKILLKAPITTPQGGGYKSLNVTMRKTLGLFANVRPCLAFHPFIKTNFPKLDIVVVRENEEDIYAGIEHKHTHNSAQSLKLITKTGSEKIMRYAFEYAVKNGRKKVTCFSKDNIMKFADGLFHQTFNEVAKDYPDIQHNHYIVDIATAKVANRPDLFDVIVTQNLYGDIISDVVAEISGSVGMAGSANIGNRYAMFEAIHGSAPDIAGKNIANPSGLINAAIMMLIHIGHGKTASLIENAWLRTLEDGIHTVDIYHEKLSSKKVSTDEFADAVIANLGKKPDKFKIADYHNQEMNKDNDKSVIIDQSTTKNLVGVDVFIDYLIHDQDKLANTINNITNNSVLGLKIISYKGLKVWPRDKGQNNFSSDLWQLRFVSRNQSKTVTHADIISLLEILSKNNIDFVKIDNLHTFGNELGFSLAQGE